MSPAPYRGPVHIRKDEGLEGLATAREMIFAGDRRAFALLLDVHSRMLAGTLAPLEPQRHQPKVRKGEQRRRIKFMTVCGIWETLSDTQDDLLGEWSLISLSCPGWP